MAWKKKTNKNSQAHREIRERCGFPHFLEKGHFAILSLCESLNLPHIFTSVERFLCPLKETYGMNHQSEIGKVMTAFDRSVEQAAILCNTNGLVFIDSAENRLVVFDETCWFCKRLTQRYLFFSFSFILKFIEQYSGVEKKHHCLGEDIEENPNTDEDASLKTFGKSLILEGLGFISLLLKVIAGCYISSIISHGSAATESLGLLRPFSEKEQSEMEMSLAFNKAVASFSERATLYISSKDYIQFKKALDTIFFQPSDKFELFFGQTRILKTYHLVNIPSSFFSPFVTLLIFENSHCFSITCKIFPHCTLIRILLLKNWSKNPSKTLDLQLVIMKWNQSY